MISSPLSQPIKHKNPHTFSSHFPLNKQQQLLLARVCIKPRLQHLLHTIEPELPSSAINIHQNATKTFLQHLLSYNNHPIDIPDSVAQQISLPPRLGGLGFFVISEIAPLAHFAALHEIHASLRKRFPCHTTEFTNFLQKPRSKLQKMILAQLQHVANMIQKFVTPGLLEDFAGTETIVSILYPVISQLPPNHPPPSQLKHLPL
jgi:hypothetical protein